MFKPGRIYALVVAVWLGVAGLLVVLGVTGLGTALATGGRAHVAIQSCGALVLCLAALFVFGRFYAASRGDASARGSAPKRMADVLLAPALGLLALTTVLFSAIPAIVSTSPSAFVIWAQSLGDIAGAGVAAVAAWVPAGWVVRRHVGAWQTVGAIAAALGVVAGAALAANQVLPTPQQGSSTLGLDWLPTEVILAGLIATAFVGFARRAVRDGDRLMMGLAVSAVLAVGAVIASIMGPDLGAGWMVIEELFLLGAYGAVLAGAWAESAAYWRRVVDLAGVEERRRVARDLHDGLTQDLTYIAMQTHALVDRYPDAAGLRRVLHASEHALDESRGAISALSCPPGEPLERVLAGCVQEVACRADAVAFVHVEDEVAPSAEVRDAVFRIACEATSNAARHGRATRVIVTVEGGEALRLTVSDNGAGFDAEAALAGLGFGLTIMQERARAAGGTLSVRSRPGEGTEVTATLPCERRQLVLAD